MEPMYKGSPFSPRTALSDSVGAEDTVLTVEDVSVFPVAPSYATIGIDEGAETVLYTALTESALSGCTRGVEGTAKAWGKGEAVSRNFTAADHNALIENTGELSRALVAHKEDSAAHVTQTEKDGWGAKETPEGAQTKADAAQAAAKAASRPVDWMPTAAETGAIPDSLKGAVNGVATLDDTGKIPVNQIPAADDGPDGPPPVIGSIKFSAASTIEEGWLLCDGRFINETDYPELVAELGKHYPSNDKFSLISNNEIPPQITNGVTYAGRMWVYSFSARKLYGVDLKGTQPIKAISISSSDIHFGSLLTPTTQKPLCLSIVPHLVGEGAALFLSQVILDGYKLPEADYTWMDNFLLFGCEFSGGEETLSMVAPFTSVDPMVNTVRRLMEYQSKKMIPYVTSFMDKGVENYHCSSGIVSAQHPATAGSASLSWVKGSIKANIVILGIGGNPDADKDPSSALRYQRMAFSKNSKGEAVGGTMYVNQYGTISGSIHSSPYAIFKGEGAVNGKITARQSAIPLNIVGTDKTIFAFDLESFPWFSLAENVPGCTIPSPPVPLPSSAKVFVDAGCYLWGKDIYVIFVGTGALFSRTLGAKDFGYLDTTEILGTISQFGFLDYSMDEGTLYILGQDSTNKVRVAKMALNTLFDYSNNGAWLPMIAADGIPAYIKAKEPPAPAAE